MRNTWDFYFTTVEGAPASILLDMRFRRLAPLKGYARMGYVRIRMRGPNEDGLAGEAEHEMLEALEAALTRRVTAKSPSLYVGRSTAGGHRNFVFYTRNADGFADAAEAAMTEEFAGYPYEIGDQEDAAWSVYFDFLFPNRDERRVMANRQAMEALAAQGDRADAPRRVDHLAVFPDGQSSRGFADYLTGQGFTLSAERPWSQRGKVMLEFWRQDAPSHLNQVTVTLARAAAEHGGKYDSWSCEVVA